MRRKRVLAWTLAAVLAGTGAVLAMPAAKGVAVAAEEDAGNESGTESAGEASGKCGENVYYTFKDGVLTISGTGKMWDFEMEGWDHYSDPPESIYSPWYEYKDEITSVKIEDNVTSVGNYAFDNCSNLQNISLTDDITEIGKCAFSWVDWNITFPKSLLSIGDEAFSFNSLMEKVDVPEGVVSIGENAFESQKLMEYIQLPGTVTSIGDSICTAQYLKEIRISPENENFYLADGVLYSKDKELLLYPGATGANSYHVLEGTVRIGAYAFYQCKELEELVLPEGLLEIGVSAFAGCNLKEVALPEGLLEIDDGAFSNLEDLKEVVIPDSVERIGEGAFGANGYLEKVTVGKNVKYIGMGAFSYSGSKYTTYTTTTPLGSIYKPTVFYFRGDCPQYQYKPNPWHESSGSIFYDALETPKHKKVYYPEGNSTWTEENIKKMDSYMGDTTYTPYQVEEKKEITILEGANGSCQTDAQSGYRIRIDEELAKFVSVSIDGAAVPEDCYTVESGSTVLTFKPEYLKTLHTGVHTVLITFTSGTAETTLTLTQPQESQNPSHNDGGADDNHANDTGESLPLVLLYGLLAGAGIGFGTWSKRKAA